MYDDFIRAVTQIAFQIDDDTLAALDRLASERSVARAEVLRMAVREFLGSHREAEIESHLARGYSERPPGNSEAELAEVSIDGLRAADLDW